jgi:hypothetical protein
LEADADLGGTLSDHADVRHGGDDFVDMARALCGTGVSVLERQPGDRWKWVSVKLQERRTSQERDQEHPSVALRGA